MLPHGTITLQFHHNTLPSPQPRSILHSSIAYRLLLLFQYTPSLHPSSEIGRGFIVIEAIPSCSRTSRISPTSSGSHLHLSIIIMSANLTVQEENELLSLCADNDNAESDTNNNHHGDGGGGENDATEQGGKRKRPPKPKKSKIYTKKNMRSMSDSELFIEFDKDLEKISNEATCFSQSTTGSGTCTCLHILRQPHLRATVANYKVGLRNKSKHEVDSIIFEWYRYAKSCADEKKGRHKPYWYMMPFDGTNALANGIDIKEIVTARICQQGMFRVMGITEARMATIRQASITGVVPVHASRGRKSNNAMSDDAHAIMTTHFNELCQFGVQAQPTAAGEVADINLPLPYSARGCYRIYLKALGYSVKYSSNGSITVHWDGNEDDEKPKYMSATTYFSVWKREFPHLKAAVDPRGVKNQRRNLYKKKAKTTPRLEETSQDAPDLSMGGMYKIAQTEAL